MPTSALRDSVYSRDRERMLEHLFLSRLLREAWTRHETTIEVLRPEADTSGYDIVLDHAEVIRHIQLKASRVGSRPGYHNLHIGLSSKPAGCVIWMEFADENIEEKMDLRYNFLGGGPRQPLDLNGYRNARTSMHTIDGGRRERPNVRRVPIGRFTRLASIAEVYDALFRLRPD